MCFFGGGGGSRAAEKQAQVQADEVRRDTEEKKGKLIAGNAAIDDAFSVFNDDYFSKLASNYTDYAKPQFDEQYADAKRNITYALARKGNLNSTVAGDQYGLLDREAARNWNDVVATGEGYSSSARRDVQGNKQDIIGQLNNTYDVGNATDSALTAARSLQVPQTYSKLPGLFSDIASIAAQRKNASDSNPDNSSYGARLYNQRYGYGVT
jgi:hypothetical protein